MKLELLFNEDDGFTMYLCKGHVPFNKMTKAVQEDQGNSKVEFSEPTHEYYRAIPNNKYQGGFMYYPAAKGNLGAFPCTIMDSIS